MDLWQKGKPFITDDPDQLSSLAIPSWVKTMSISETRAAKRHTVVCPVSD